MPTTIINKLGKGAPSASKLSVGEIAQDEETGALYVKKLDGAVVEVSGSGSGGGTGSSVHIGENPPADPQEGQQWMEVPASGDATMWIYDDGNGGQWLQHPGGKDGAPGVDGADGKQIWSEVTPDGDIYYDKGRVGIGANNSKGALSITGSDPNYRDYLSLGDSESSARLHFTPWSTLAQDRVYLSFNLFRSDYSPDGMQSGFGKDNPSVGMSYVGFLSDGSLSFGTSEASSADQSPPERLRIDATGDATFSKNVYTHTVVFNNGAGLSADGKKRILPYNASGAPEDGTVSLGREGGGGTTAYKFKDGWFSGTVSAGDTRITETGKIWQEGHCGIRMSTIGGGGAETLCMISLNSAGAAQINTGFMDIGRSNYPFKDAHFSGTVNSQNTRAQRIIQDGSPVIDAKGLIKTLSTLRNATKDETTIKGLRDAIGNAIGGLIEEFESQIATMPAEDEA